MSNTPSSNRLSLTVFFRYLDGERESYAEQIPSVMAANRLIDALYHWLFPVSDCGADYRSIDRYTVFFAELMELLQPLSDGLKATPSAIADQFFEAVPGIYARLMDDAQAFYRYDPAAVSIGEVIAAYPGYYAIAVHRMAHHLDALGVPLLPRLWSEYAHSKTGIDIHPGATIGNAFFIDHGTGVVIGATAVIGNEVRIYQGVTLGALQVDKSMASTKRHPTIEDNCIIYANSTILGGKTVVGHDSVIGGNTWLTESVPPHSLVLHQPRIKVRSRTSSDEPINFVI
jgi:serine O-acetyltransferase